jgi:hypothetical protein
MRTLRFGLVVGALAGCAGTPSDSPDPEMTRSIAEALSTSLSTGVAWVWNDRPGVGLPYFPPARYAFNSAGGSITIESEHVGSYYVNLRSLGDFGGNAQVVAYGSGGRAVCRVQRPYRTLGGDEQIAVKCRDSLTNVLTPTQFVLFFAKNAPARTEAPNSTRGAYLTTAWLAGGLGAIDEWNSTGAASTVTRTGVGTYTVLLPGLTRGGGSVMVTTMLNTDTARCKPGWFTTDASGTTIDVRCFDTLGPADATFSLHYTSGITYHSWATQGMGAYVWAADPSSASYTPPAAYQYIYGPYSFRPSTALRFGTGAYAMRYNDLLRHAVLTATPRDTSLVTAYGVSNDYCEVGSWGTNGLDVTANVACFNGVTGAPADARYLHTFMHDRIPTPP